MKNAQCHAQARRTEGLLASHIKQAVTILKINLVSESLLQVIVKHFRFGISTNLFCLATKDTVFKVNLWYGVTIRLQTDH